MRHLRTEIEIEASTAQVWAILTDYARYPEWNPLIREATISKADGLNLFICIEGLAKRRVDVKLLTVAPERELRWLGRFLMPHLLDGDHRFLLTALGPSRVRLEHEERFGGLLVPLVAGRLMTSMKAGFEALNQALKTRAEASSGVR